MLEMSMVPAMEQRVTPALLTLTRMLAMPAAELHQLVQHELGDNPALEEIEVADDADMSTDEWLQFLAAQQTSDAPAMPASLGDAGDEATDPWLFIAAPPNVREQLLIDLRVSSPTADHPIARLLVESLDEQGFLPNTAADYARTLNVTTERVVTVLQRLQAIGPTGIATANVQECLLAQLAELRTEGYDYPHAVAVIRDHFDDLAAHRDARIAHQLATTPSDIQAIRQLIQQHCSPYPLQPTFDTTSNRPRYNQPDVAIIHHEDDTYHVEVLHSPRRRLQLNPLYRELVQRASTLDDEEREHVRSYLARARTFLTNLRQRESTLQAIVTAIITYQVGFLREGVRQLQPLTRAEIAAEVGVHESTVSRAASSKIVMLPDGYLMPLSEFFIAARPIQDVLREIVATEPHPLSDSEIATALSEQGFAVARRTVAKYRKHLNILPSHLRHRTSMAK